MLRTFVVLSSVVVQNGLTQLLIEKRLLVETSYAMHLYQIVRAIDSFIHPIIHSHHLNVVEIISFSHNLLSNFISHTRRRRKWRRKSFSIRFVQPIKQRPVRLITIIHKLYFSLVLNWIKDEDCRRIALSAQQMKSCIFVMSVRQHFCTWENHWDQR